MDNLKLYAFADEASASIDGQIDALLRNGLDGLEIRGVDGTNIADITVEKAHEVKSKLDKHGLSVFSIGSPIGKISIDDDFVMHLEKFKHILELAKILGAKNMRIFSFYTVGNPDACADKVLERLNALVSASRGSGITLCCENEKGLYGDAPDRALTIFRSIPEIRAIFDPANFVQCGINPIDAYNKLKNYIEYMHVKDSRTNGAIVPAGYGDGRIAEVVSDLIESGKTAFTLEPHLVEFDGLAGLERDGERSNIGLFSFSDANTAFDAAVTAFDKIIGRIR